MRKTLLSFFAAAAAIICSSAVSAVELKDKVVGDFAGNMVITITTEGETGSTDPVPAVVTITENAGAFGLQLKNFLFMDNGSEFYVGNIEADGVAVQEADGKISVNIEKGIEITPGDAGFEYEGEPVGEDAWLGPAITETCGGAIPITLAGTVTGKEIDIQIDLDITDALGMVISVKFEGTNPNIVDISNDLTNVASITAYTSADGSTLYVKGLDGQAAYAIYNVLGSAVASGVVSDTIDISSLPKGIYLIKVGNTTVKFSK